MQEAAWRQTHRLGCGDKHSGVRHTDAAGVEGHCYVTRQTRVRALSGRVQEITVEHRKNNTTPYSWDWNTKIYSVH